MKPTDGPGPGRGHALVLSAAQMRAADEAASAQFGVPSLLLMENAGRGLAELLLRECAPRVGPRVRVVCGAGANGGDGLVAARHLALAGADVRVFLVAARAKMAGDAAINLAAATALDTVAIEDAATWDDPARAWRAALADADAVVDAVFGIGLHADVIGVPATAILAMNAAPGLKVAADIPSGLDADSGRIHAVGFRAHVTATMGARKLGPALDADAPAGRVEVISLGVPLRAPIDRGPLAFWLEEAVVAAALPRRTATSHKGSAGHALIVAGSAGKTGAAVLAGRAAMRAGAGLVTLASTAAGQVSLDAKLVELMSAHYAPGDDADSGSAAAIAGLAARMKAMAIGPGIPTGPTMAVVVRELGATLPLPMVIDADALNLLGAEHCATLAAAPGPRVLTPHPGEAARLLGISTAAVQEARLSSARTLATQTKAIVVLKGARTLIAQPDGTVFINPTADGALATAGSGDVLTGVITALLTQGLAPIDAAIAGVFVHGAAGAEAALRTGGVIAGDLPEAVATVMARLRATAPDHPR
ncbi:MAG TPA: NAD(P)H-hydrate dehydratase [Polyangia bacterium]|jgi:NAD(P)H-hydrate epimerase|nr:NAD(P)H-hydrate dehydratase [Polyangia bacterium]